MILSDTEIFDAVADGDIVIEPAMEPDQLQPASVDVRIGSELYDVDADTHIRTDRLCLQPGQFYLGTTQERVELPNDIAAQLAGRSSLGRMGVVVHKTAGWIDPGFQGQITLELYNFSTTDVIIHPGDRVGQLVFMRLSRPSQGYDGQYQQQTGIQPAGEL